MKKIYYVFLSMVLFLAMTACSAVKAQNFSYLDLSSSGDRSLSSGTSSANEKSQESSSVTVSSSTALSQESSSVTDGSSAVLSQASSSQSSRSVSVSSSTPAESTDVSPSPTISLGTPMVFDDLVCENLLRDCIHKPIGTCYISDFSDLSQIGTSSVYIEYHSSTNKTTLFDSYSEVGSEAIGMPSSFAALSQIPVRNLTFYYLDDPGSSDFSMTFNMSGITASHELLSFVIKGRDTNPFRTSLEQYVILAGFNTLSACSKLKALTLWDCKGVNLDSISSLQNLEVVSLVNCNVTSLEPLRNAAKLWKLEVCYNNVTDFTPLTNNPSLREVRLIDIKVPIDVDTLITCPKFKFLYLNGCIALTLEQRNKLALKGVTVEGH